MYNNVYNVHIMYTVSLSTFQEVWTQEEITYDVVLLLVEHIVVQHGNIVADNVLELPREGIVEALGEGGGGCYVLGNRYVLLGNTQGVAR